MITGLPPTKLVNTYVSWQMLSPYFKVGSIEDLVIELRKLRSESLLYFDIRINAEYFEWQRKRIDLKQSGDIGSDLGFGALHKDEFGLGRILTGVDVSKPLNEFVAIDVITRLPTEVASKYIEFRLYDLDRSKLKHLVVNTRKRKQAYGAVTYKGLTISDAQVTYHGEPIHLGFREQEALRTFLERPEILIPSSTFTSNPDIFSPNKTYPNRHKTCSQLISDLRLKLIPVIDQRCIYNQPSEGWRFRID